MQDVQLSCSRRIDRVYGKSLGVKNIMVLASDRYAVRSQADSSSKQAPNHIRIPRMNHRLYLAVIQFAQLVHHTDMHWANSFSTCK